MEKRGQASQVLIYAITVIIIALMVVLGYKGINMLTSSGEKAQITKFKNDFDNLIDSGSTYGRKKTHDVLIPEEWDEICLIDERFVNKGEIPLTYSDDTNITNALVLDSLPYAEENVFLIKGITTIDAFRVDPMEVTNGGFCSKIPAGKIKLRLEGLGDKTKVTEK